MTGYRLLDSGYGEKLEQFGKYTLVRPSPQAVWAPHCPETVWHEADARFSRGWHRDEEGGWDGSLPSKWTLDLEGISLTLSPTNFGHLGIFPEHAVIWRQLRSFIAANKGVTNFLNLFAYSGAATLVAAKAGAEVCHLDASKGMVDWARANAVVSGLEQAPIRWIVDDACKFLRREIKRGRRYNLILLDPPTFGRGAQGEVFKIERDLSELLDLLRQLLPVDSSASRVILSTHTAGWTPRVLGYLLEQHFGPSSAPLETGELLLEGSEEGVLAIPSGSYASWST